MASISSLKASSSTSNPHSYDVFLSFRGKDTRKTFTGHLYANLVAHGIHTFRDDEELEKGGDIASDLSRAIEESSIFIVVFSRDYATSKWCLNELVKIIDCMTKKKIKVVPVFYHVDPRDVGNQEGSFNDAFLDHAKDADEEKKEMIEEWKIVLKKASKLSGYHVDDQHEADVIREIREAIIKKLNRKPLHVGDNVVGMDVHLNQLKSLIKTELDEVRTIGVYGIGGIGKTTIAMAIYNDISSQFDGSTFLRNVGGKCEDGLLELQKTLLQDILKGKRLEFNSTSEGINVIKGRLCSKRVLIVLDDVDDIEQLNNLAGKIGWYGAKSRIIITTKDTHLLKRHGVDAIYEVKELNHEEATELFNWWAFKQNIPKFEEDFESLSHCVIEYAKGLPIALEVLGGFLFGKNTDEWRSALHKLEKTPDKKVQSALRGTKKIEGLFIDMSTSRRIQFSTKVFKRMNKLRLLKVYNWYGNEVHLPMDFEFSSCELRYLYWDGYPLESLPKNFDATNLVELDLIYGSIKQLWKRNEILDNLKVINLSYSKNLIELPDFSSMPNLEILILEGCTCLECLPRNFHKLELLRSLSCDGCSKLKRFPEIGRNMRNLRELNLSKTAITEVPSSIRHLHGLKDLNLSYCKDLAILPEAICSLSSLKNLRLDWCSKLKDLPEMKADMGNLERLDLSSTAIEELPSSIGHLKALKHLDLSCCENLVSLPGSISNLSSLETLYLLECSRLKHFPDIRGDMKNLKTLDLQSTTMKELPSSIGRLHALEHLYLSGCKNLVDLPESICNLSSLKLSIYLGIKELPSSIGRLHALEHLYLSGCKDLVNLPESICNLSSLKTLHVRDCSKLHGLKLDLGGLQCLEDLQLSYISCDWGCLSGLCSLRSLHLSCCNLKQGLIQRNNFFSKLKRLVVNDCNLREGGIPSDIRHLIKISIEQNHPPMVEGSSSHQKFGHHGSAEGDTNGNSHNKRNPTEHSPTEEQRHKRFRGIQD
ncbi:TMV resistance protein N [Vitis vinifera]|uniref:TMV resistance protein N n=1 Tax=Vitis vinifera TaxID=29760 RepID=A0A438FJA2_VITVI|nr:TMV resistance protein N [Vitis vinifera]